jgi:hypothetical protein
MQLYFAFLLLGFSIVAFEVTRKKQLKFDFLTFANLFFFISYVITPLYFEYYSEYALFELTNLTEILLLCWLGYLFFILGWQVLKEGNIQLKSHYSIEHYKVKSLLIVISLLTILGLVTASLYIYGAGGIVNALSSGALMRYGYEDVEVSQFSFLLQFLGILPVAVLFTFAMMLTHEFNFAQIRIRSLYCLALLVFLLLTIITASRGSVVELLILHVFVYAFFGKIKVVPLVIVSATVFLFISFGKEMFFSIALALRGEDLAQTFSELGAVRSSTADNLPLFFRLFKEFHHPTYSLDIAYSAAGQAVNYTYFLDFPASLIRVIPQRLSLLFIEKPVTISLINSQLLHDLDIATTPPGLIAHFFYASGTFGVCLGMFIFGLAGRWASIVLTRVVYQNKSFYAFYIIFAFMYGSFITNGDPHVYFYSLLWPLIMFASLIFLLKRGNVVRRLNGI